MEEKKKIAIAIDGPAAAGKSTVATRVAEILGFTYIDTGAMYRAFTYAVIKKGLDPTNEQQSCLVIPEVDITLTPDHRVFCNGEDVSEVIRTPLVSSQVSYIASYKDIRIALVKLQQKMAEKDSVVMDGRDIGTNVLPNAEVKIYLLADFNTRVMRRFEENIGKKLEVPYGDVAYELFLRDRIDSTRDFAPLKAAPDSIYIYSTPSSKIEDVVEAILEKVHQKTGMEIPCH
ncbi:MAG: (d)CMP kinase [Bacillota bacterium]|nr:(d)CMP kinase [Bacillota bacterium]